MRPPSGRHFSPAGQSSTARPVCIGPRRELLTTTEKLSSSGDALIDSFYVPPFTISAGRQGSADDRFRRPRCKAFVNRSTGVVRDCSSPSPPLPPPPPRVPKLSASWLRTAAILLVQDWYKNVFIRRSTCGAYGSDQLRRLLSKVPQHPHAIIPNWESYFVPGS